ncbi:uncharacterized protein AB675_2069 [Cyphellophora attinorum]|uniref:Uncharacterized protein n=1 Tax=Cyphellophora attinorum TaxID=1664694 RepID=A0A0N1HDU0_9EURO|nr:uncharacterized protein AB675_2069 [Phialophora attinorum]KPI42924.1 hypothetical protein AB675_2069 [Phialophora attinorum]
MVIGLMIIMAIPTITGTAQAYSAQKTQEDRKKEEKRMKKFYIDVGCDAEFRGVENIRGHRVVLRNDRVYLGPTEATNPSRDGYVAEAFYIEYPDSERNPVPLGLVSQTRAEPPLLNWIYVDKETAELKYGNKTQSIEHMVGPWDWTKDESRITFTKKQLFIAVEDPRSKVWQLYYDIDDDGLAKFVTGKRRKRMVYVDLNRTEMPET